MATLKLYHDTRATDGNTEAPLKIALTHHSRTIYINIGVKIFPDEWDSRSRTVLRRPDAASLNRYISGRMAAINLALLDLRSEMNVDSLSAVELRDMILARVSPQQEQEVLFMQLFERFANTHTRPSTRNIYAMTVSKVYDFEPNADSLRFTDITKFWLRDFERYLSDGSGTNTISIHLRNIRAAFNFAIDEGLTEHYPFRAYKIKKAEVTKRSFTVEQLRSYIFAEGLAAHDARYRDYFTLIFLLCGINTVDLYGLQSITSDGRIEYNRAKTGKHYSIKVEPEAMEIIERLRGRNQLVNIADTYTNHKDHQHHWNSSIRRVCKSLGLPEATTYWARHTWATIAYDLDIPIETISQALGHGYGNATTAIYINPSRDKVDRANRKVIDWVFYEKK